MCQEVDAAKAQQYANSIDAIFFETSAKTNSNVFDLFAAISKRLPEPVEEADDRIDPERPEEPKPKKSGCCSIM